jgi:MATE family multidrug resistance protein
MLFALLGLLLLVPVGRVLAYGGLGIHALGAVGCGLAGAIVNAVQAVAFLAWMRRDLGRLVRPDPRILLRLLRLGLPMAGGVMLEVGAFTFASLAMGRFGEIAAASHQVALNVASVTFMLPLGLSMAMTVRVGLAFGRRDRAAMRRAGLAGLAIVLATQTVSSCLMIGLPRAIAALYTPDPRVIAGAAALLVLAGVFQFSDGIQVAAAGALRGLQDVRAPVAICLVAYWGIGIPAGLALAFAAGWRVPGMWVGLICGLTAAAALLSARFLRLTRPAHADVAARLAA